MSKKAGKISKRHTNHMKRIYDDLQNMRLKIIQAKIDEAVKKYNCKTSDCELVFYEGGDLLPRALTVRDKESYLIGVIKIIPICQSVRESTCN